MVDITQSSDWRGYITSFVMGFPVELVLISNEGEQFSSWCFLLAIHSPVIAELLQFSSHPLHGGMIAITLPVSSIEISQLLLSLEKDLVMENSLAARILSIKKIKDERRESPEKYQMISILTNLCRKIN